MFLARGRLGHSKETGEEQQELWVAVHREGEFNEGSLVHRISSIKLCTIKISIFVVIMPFAGFGWHLAGGPAYLRPGCSYPSRPLTEMRKLDQLEAEFRSNLEKVDCYTATKDFTRLGRRKVKTWDSGNVEAKRAILVSMRSNIHWNEEKLYFSTSDWLNAFVRDLPAVNAEIEAFEHENSLTNQYDLEKIRKMFPS